MILVYRILFRDEHLQEGGVEARLGRGTENCDAGSQSLDPPHMAHQGCPTFG